MRWLRFALIFAALLVLCLSACTNGDDDDDDDSQGDDDDGAYCDISAGNLAKIPVSGAADDCQSLGLDVVIDAALTNPTMRVFEVQGQFAISNENQFFIRGSGLGDALCFDTMVGSGEFDVFTELLECAEVVMFDVVTAVKEDAQPFCTVTVYMDLNCDPGDDDTADDDDTIGDDDTVAGDDCTSAYTKMYVDCAYHFTDEMGEEIALEDVISWCEADLEGYGFDGDLTQCILASSCSDLRDCW